MIVTFMVMGWVFGYIMATVVKDFQFSSRHTQFEERMWSRIDSAESRLSTAERLLGELNARAPREYPPKAWLDDTFRPLVMRVDKLERQ